jgi:hypothetical protein
MPLNYPPSLSSGTFTGTIRERRRIIEKGGKKRTLGPLLFLSSLDTIRMPLVVQFVKRGVLPANLASCSVISQSSFKFSRVLKSSLEFGRVRT